MIWFNEFGLGSEFRWKSLSIFSNAPIRDSHQSLCYDKWFLHSSHADKWTSRMPTTKNHGVIFVVRTKVNKYWYIFHSKGSNRMTNSYVKMINAYFPDYLNNDCRRRWLNSSQMAVRTCNKSITKGNKREKTNIYFNILSPRLKSTFL